MGNPSYSVLQVALVISDYPLFPLRTSCEIIDINVSYKIILLRRCLRFGVFYTYENVYFIEERFCICYNSPIF